MDTHPAMLRNVRRSAHMQIPPYLRCTYRLKSIDANTDLHVKACPTRIIETICSAEVLSMTAFSGFATLLPVLALEFGLNNTEAGLISGTVSGSYIAACPFPARWPIASTHGASTPRRH
jgi:hypothetical protein